MRLECVELIIENNPINNIANISNIKVCYPFILADVSTLYPQQLNAFFSTISCNRSEKSSQIGISVSVVLMTAKHKLLYPCISLYSCNARKDLYVFPLRCSQCCYCSMQKSIYSDSEKTVNFSEETRIMENFIYAEKKLYY